MSGALPDIAGAWQMLTRGCCVPVGARSAGSLQLKRVLEPHCLGTNSLSLSSSSGTSLLDSSSDWSAINDAHPPDLDGQVREAAGTA